MYVLYYSRHRKLYTITNHDDKYECKYELMLIDCCDLRVIICMTHREFSGATSQADFREAGRCVPADYFGVVLPYKMCII